MIAIKILLFALAFTCVSAVLILYAVETIQNLDSPKVKFDTFLEWYTMKPEMWGIGCDLDNCVMYSSTLYSIRFSFIGYLRLLILRNKIRSKNRADVANKKMSRLMYCIQRDMDDSKQEDKQ